MSNLNNNTTQLEALLAKVNALPEAGSGGIDTSDATATADEIFAGETAYTATGKVTGTFTIEDELTEQNDLISQITTLVAQKANPPSTDTSDATATANDILSGKTAYAKGSKITGAIPSKAAITYTPSTSDQTIASGTYLTGIQTIVGDANLVGSNIKSGVSIFGVAGTYEGSGGSGGSSGTVETCYCMIGAKAPTMEPGTVTYTNADMQIATRRFDLMSGTRVEVVKGTIVTITPWANTSSCSGDCTKIFTSVTGGAYSINGDSNLTYG